MLHPLPTNLKPGITDPTYWYEGRCPQTGVQLRLPRTALVEAIARHRMQHLATDPVYSQEGKMYGVLLVETPMAEKYFLQAFSGLLNGQSVVAGWVPPIPGREQVAVEEAQTLAQLEAMKQELIALQHLPERQWYEARSQVFQTQLNAMSDRHAQRKHERHEKRQRLLNTLLGEELAIALAQLEEQSRQDGIEKRHLKRQRDTELKPLQSIIESANARMLALKHDRKARARQLQALMHTAYRMTNFAGETRPLHHLMPMEAMPTGTGDCCAPKLLHYAATHHLKPLAMAEFWWGKASANGDKVPGQFYGACEERCQPLMGFLLSGLNGGLTYHVLGSMDQGSEAPSALPILYQDEALIVVDKPAGLLSVPGRTSDRQDCTLYRLQAQYPDTPQLWPVHRLDQDTSGILIIARTKAAYQSLNQQFQARTVKKVYEALLDGVISHPIQYIELPLWSDPTDRPYQKVNWQHGKPSTTQVQVITVEGDRTRVEFIPITGRTHQLRVHAADPQGLGVPIVGDRLYGRGTVGDRLHLHARDITLHHPHTNQLLQIHSPCPF